MPPASLKPDIEDPAIDALRVKIDAIDQRLLQLIAERLEVVHQVGEEKRQKGLKVFDPNREEKLLRKLISVAPPELDEQAVRNIFAALVRECRRLEEVRMKAESQNS